MSDPHYRLVIADDHPLFRGALREAVTGLIENAEDQLAFVTPQVNDANTELGEWLTGRRGWGSVVRSRGAGVPNALRETRRRRQGTTLRFCLRTVL